VTDQSGDMGGRVALGASAFACHAIARGKGVVLLPVQAVRPRCGGVPLGSDSFASQRESRKWECEERPRMLFRERRWILNLSPGSQI
jgi:hypothetical protein